MRLRLGRPLLGDTPRRRAVLALAACVAVVVALGLLFNGETGPDSFDHAVDSPVTRLFVGRHVLLLWLASPGTVIPAVVISVVVAAGCLVTGRLNGAVLAVAAVPVATALDDALLKHLFHRTYLGQVAFPSGHTGSAVALTATLAVLLLVPPQQARTRGVRLTLVVVACAVTAVVATAVIGLRWHYFTDCLAGAAVGLGTVLALALLLDLLLGVAPGDRSHQRGYLVGVVGRSLVPAGPKRGRGCVESRLQSLSLAAAR
jgi:membrane-associated phospholipid phosphatase